MLKCSLYQTTSSRISRCKELKLCTLCSSAKHSEEDCPARKYELSYECGNCGSRSHIGALCPKLVQVQNGTKL